ncbi:MAG: biotin--[acetyl-CoA-carboxylase] ligase [Candidatus Margulisbacteria bacterium]|nr:biotin--[acetyl-CoA-carboxylase] ligase [Candidatus Margulisiibacteriota bacterium]
MYSLQSFKELPSTNTYALQNLAKLSDKQVVVADKQTAGRGRFNREWFSDIPGNVYLSIILKPKDTNRFIISALSHFTAIIICRTLEEYKVRANIKWPNDILVKGQKIAGILAESSFSGQQFLGLVMGIGVNLNMPQEFPKRINRSATSLNLLQGKEVNRDFFITSFLNKFFECYDKYCETGFPIIKKEYIKKSSFIGEKVNVKCGEDIKSGIAQSLTDNGELILLTDSGTLEEISVGEIY